MRLIAADGEQVGIVSIEDALKAAEESNLDLVEISPTADPPVCRVMNFGKYRFEKEKKKKQKSKRIQLKEIKYRPGTEVGDYNIKLRKCTEFLEAGHKVKASLRFRGRELAHQELGRDLLERLQEDLKEIGTVESMPKMEGRQMIMVIGPKK